MRASDHLFLFPRKLEDRLYFGFRNLKRGVSHTSHAHRYNHVLRSSQWSRLLALAGAVIFMPTSMERSSLSLSFHLFCRLSQGCRVDSTTPTSCGGSHNTRRGRRSYPASRAWTCFRGNVSSVEKVALSPPLFPLCRSVLSLFLSLTRLVDRATQR